MINFFEGAYPPDTNPYVWPGFQLGRETPHTVVSLWACTVTMSIIHSIQKVNVAHIIIIIRGAVISVSMRYVFSNIFSLLIAQLYHFRF